MKKILFVLSVCSVFFVGCTIHSGTLNPANVIIQENNFQKVKTIYGSASATYILGIGGNKKEGLVNEAKQNLYSKHNFSPHQSIVNITYDISRQLILGVYYKQTCYMSADVVEFAADGKFNANIENNFNLNQTNNKLKYGCILGDCENGKGTYLWKSGNKYTGEWKSGKMNGVGTYYWKNGDKYEGDWVNDLMDGNGVYTYKNGDVEKGLFKEDDFIEEKP